MCTEVMLDRCCIGIPHEQETKLPPAILMVLWVNIKSAAINISFYLPYSFVEIASPQLQVTSYLIKISLYVLIVFGLVLVDT